MKKLILLYIYLCFFKLSAQQAGDLDTSFAQNGIGVTNISEVNNVEILSQAIQNDGKIILAGRYGSGTGSKAYVKRLNTDGSTDLSFSDNGCFISNIIPEARYLKIQYDGKILLSSKYKVIRLDSNGTIDTSFNIISYTSIEGIEVQWFDKILILYNSGSNTKIARYFSDGLLDTSFGINGYYSTSSSLSSMLLLPNQKILLASNGSTSLHYAWSVEVINSNGVGSSYLCGESGVWSSPNISHFRNFYFQPDNKILVVSSNKIRRYNQDFSIDTTFGNYGTFESTYPLKTSIKTTTEGKIVVLLNYVNTVFLVRYNNNGTYDTSFDGDGVYQFPQIPYSYEGSLLNIYNNEIFVSLSSNQNNTLYKFNTNGELDSSFGDGGQKLIIENIDSNDSIIKSLIQTDGKLLLCGKNATNSVAIVRYNIDGSVDTSYGVQGRFIYYIGTTQYNLDFEIQTDDKIVMLHYNNFIRIDSTGQIDSSFGVNGIQSVVIPVLNPQTSELTCFKILPDNKIIAIRSNHIILYDNSGQYFVVLVKLNNDGSFDTSFNGLGYAVHNLYNNNDVLIYNIAVRNDSKIVIGGAIDNPSIYQKNMIAQFNSDGTRDVNFGTDGVFLLNVFTISTNNLNYEINSMDLQADGKIVINSLLNNGSVVNNFLLSRVNPNGTLDTGFGTNGIVQTPIENSCNSNFVKVCIT
jgi:uncharacterized delta-60 repeat protein